MKKHTPKNLFSYLYHFMLGRSLLLTLICFLLVEWHFFLLKTISKGS